MGKGYTFALATFAALGSFLFGYDSGVMTDVIASKHFLHYFNTNSSSPILGAIVSTFAGGACIGALSGGFTMDRLGRRRSIQIGAFVCVVGAVLQAASVHLAMILVGRIITGWAVGIMSMAVPVYQSECSHPKYRGFIVGLAQQMIGVGYIVSTWIGFGAAHVHNADHSAFTWRFPLAFQAVPAGLLAIGLFWLPESPRQLIEHDQNEEALRVLKRLHYDGTNMQWIEKELNDIMTTFNAEKSITVQSWSLMFTQPQWRTRLFHGVAVQVFTQLSGINVIGYYQTTMYDSLGIHGNKNLLVTAIYNLVGPITSMSVLIPASTCSCALQVLLKEHHIDLIFIYYFIDRVGRRKPLLTGTVLITILLCVEAIVVSQNPGGTHRGLSIFGVAVLFMVSIVFSFSFGPISWTYMSEVMPMQIRGRGNAFATGIGNWAVNVLFSQVSPQALGKLGWKYYFVFVAFNIVITFPTIFFVFKETKGVALEDIDLLFGERALGVLPEDLDKAETRVEEREMVDA